MCLYVCEHAYTSGAYRLITQEHSLSGLPMAGGISTQPVFSTLFFFKDHVSGTTHLNAAIAVCVYVCGCTYAVYGTPAFFVCKR